MRPCATPVNWDAPLEGAAADASFAVDLRRCSGSARFGIEPHEALAGEFPKQPSRKDGLGVMCTEHWRAHVKGLREAREAAKPVEVTASGAEETDAA